MKEPSTNDNIDIHQLCYFSENEAAAIIEKTFEDLSIEAAKNVGKNIEMDVPINTQKLPTVESSSASIPIDSPPIHTNESIQCINDFSGNEADAIMNEMFEDFNQNNSDKTYHLLSFENGPSNQSDISTVVNVNMSNAEVPSLEHIDEVNLDINKNVDITNKLEDNDNEELFDSDGVTVDMESDMDRTNDNASQSDVDLLDSNPENFKCGKNSVENLVDKSYDKTTENTLKQHTSTPAKESTDVNKLKTPDRDAEDTGTSLEDYDVIDEKDITPPQGKDLNAHGLSWSILSGKIKRTFTLDAELNKKSDTDGSRVRNIQLNVSVHVEEVRNGEEMQVLTFSRSPLKPKTIENDNLDVDVPDGPFIIKQHDSIGSVSDFQVGMVEVDVPSEPMSEPMSLGTEIVDEIKNDLEEEEIFVTAFGRKPAFRLPDASVKSPVSPDNPVLKLTSRTLTLNKNALITDRYPAVLSNHPSDRRSNIVLEIYTTERTFVRGLEIAVKVFKAKLTESCLLDDKEIYSIFSNIEEILLLNTDLLHQIFERVSRWSFSDEECIGDVFLLFKDDFSKYAEFCKNYDTGEEIIRQKKKKKDFETLLQECYSNPKCMIGQTISSYLITVIQRIPRYILLLKDLIKRTSISHPDYKPLEDALAIMEVNASYINDQLKQAQCQKALEALQTQITGLVQFYTPDRTLVHEGPVCLLTAQKTYQGVLFNDILVFAHKGDNKQSVVELVLELKTVWVEDLEMLDPQTTKGDSIGVYTPDRPYRMYVGTVGEKKIWLQHFRAALSTIINNGKHSNDTQTRNTSYMYKNGMVYEGSFHSTKRHGHGKLTIPNIMTYEGAWEDDEKNGFGVARYYTGEVYEGYWSDDRQEGQGTFKYISGEEISCKWRNGIKTGPCEITYKNGDKFTGLCVDDNIEGHGKLICTNGFAYIGNWAKNMKHGKGQLKVPNKLEYNGHFIRDRFHGNGELLYHDGSYYEGEFENGVRFGDGRFTTDGCTYEGKWIDDKKNGRGKMIYENKDVYIGTWLMDNRHGEGKLTYSHGGHYKGSWETDLMHGTGIREFKDGSVYDGEFSCGMISGYGTMKYSDGSTYVGNWHTNLPNGKGVLTKPGGWICDGHWLNGKQNGLCSLKDNSNDYKYKGDWLNGIKEGHGIETRNGFTYEGGFLEDMYHGKGREMAPRCSKYEGTWHHGLKHGKGVLTHANNLIEHQKWKHGSLIESPLYVPRERSPLQRWMHM